MVKIPPHIKIIQTIYLRFKYVVNNTAARNMFGVLFYKKVRTECKEGGQIILNDGRLEIGKHWTKRAVFPSLLSLGKNAKIIVNGSFSIYDNSAIYVNEGAVLELGSGYINSKASISCFKKIVIGKNVVISEGVTIRDSDNHKLVNSVKEKTKEIVIQDNVWIGINVTILKGVTIGEGSVVAAGAVIIDDVMPHSLVGGIPAAVIKSNVEWIR